MPTVPFPVRSKRCGGSAKRPVFLSGRRCPPARHCPIPPVKSEPERQLLRRRQPAPGGGGRFPPGLFRRGAGHVPLRVSGVPALLQHGSGREARPLPRQCGFPELLRLRPAPRRSGQPAMLRIPMLLAVQSSSCGRLPAGRVGGSRRCSAAVPRRAFAFSVGERPSLLLLPPGAGRALPVRWLRPQSVRVEELPHPGGGSNAPLFRQ